MGYIVSIKGKNILPIKSIQDKTWKRHEELDDALEEMKKVLIKYNVSTLLIFDPDVKIKNT